MKNASAILIIVLCMTSGCIFSCSDNQTEKSEKGAIEKMSDETAKKVSDKMLTPVEKAKTVKGIEENRSNTLQDAAEKSAGGQ